MRRLVRHVFTVVAAASMLLCAAVCAVWVRSYGGTDYFSWIRADGVGWLQSARGDAFGGLELGDWSGWPPERYGFRHVRDPRPGPLGATGVDNMAVLNVGPGDTFILWKRGGFAFGLWRPPGGANLIARASAPLWSVALATFAMPFGWLALRHRARARARRRVRLGLCRGCGYDLRACPGACPECGTPAPPRPSKAHA